MSKIKANLSKLQDSPWHIGFVKKKEDDPRRHRSRCAHYRTNGTCSLYSHCIGSAHCAFYLDAPLDKEKTKEKEKRRSIMEKVPEMPVSKLVQIGDIVTLYSLQEKEDYVITIKSDSSELPEIQKACLGRKLDERFTCCGYSYIIKKIEKAVKV